MELRDAARRAAGHTLVETVVSTAVFVVMATGMFSMMKDSSQVMQTTVRATSARRHCADVTALLARELAESNPTTLVIDHSGADGDLLKLQAPLALANGVVSWGASDKPGRDGTVHAGATIQYLLAKDPTRSKLFRLVRRVVDAKGVQLGSDLVVASHVDSVDKRTGKAFAAERTGDLVVLKLRIREAADDAGTGQDDMVRSHQITIRLRNL